jgi:preprotein translocase subunit SecA
MAGSGVAARVAGGLAPDPMARAMRESTNGGPGSAPGSGAKPGFTPSGARIGRNDQCYCGSGLKYKKCHGR